jgi:hypothetical protein
VRPKATYQPVLLVVEGAHDIEFLRRLSRILHAADSDLPDLACEELGGNVLFVPAGGGNVGSWTLRLSALGFREFHLYDREMSPETELRRQLVDTINTRPLSQARLTHKRGLENYLHAAAICEAGGVTVELTDDDSTADLAARAVFAAKPADISWQQLTVRTRKRLRDRAKRWLNTRAVERMTMLRLNQRDPDGEVVGWLQTIAALLKP